jgi:hypothetical protein
MPNAGLNEIHLFSQKADYRRMISSETIGEAGKTDETSSFVLFRIKKRDDHESWESLHKEMASLLSTIYYIPARRSLETPH